MGGRNVLANARRRRLEAAWVEMYTESTPAERQAARGYVLAQRYPRPEPAAAGRPRRWRRFHLPPVIIGDAAAPAALLPSPTWLRQFAGLAAFCALSLIGISSIYWGPALAQGWLMAALPHVSNPPVAAGVLAVWSALVSFPLGLSVLGTHAALRQMAAVV